ncbi:PI31 proteasome regulator domain containing protein [Nitzschia inconspicua]|uniref:PI31 proteasome regulator domain containing protein n=2 Tax=Nitzschia inconspicua TaxID=303405 RepID=A0A9K3K8R4_9STRA|nr:PI31 proteasome regulator domain containing protein [Nitzschia inconspicua]
MHSYSSSNLPSSKKPKMSSERNQNSNSDPNDDFDIVKEYLLQCPELPRDNPAIKCAIDAVEREKQRRIRDAKLQSKFGGMVAPVTTDRTNAGDSAAGNSTSTLSDGDVVVVENIHNSGNAGSFRPRDFTTDDDQDSMEWQDVQQHKEDNDPVVKAGSDSTENCDGSFLGKELSKASIDAIAQYRVHVSSPLAAIAVALHASLRSPILGFACTGIPEDPKKYNGFAPPVRELPQSQFLPLHWENDPNNISLRYRKNGTGALVLKLCIESDGATVNVTLGPANSKEPPARTMTFSLTDHVNLDSWNAALKAAGGANKKTIAPSLHYKGLAMMLSTFCGTFDLGSVLDSEDADMEVPYVDNTVVYGKNGGQKSNSTTSSTARPSPSDPPGVQPVLPTRNEAPECVGWKDGRVPATLDQAFPDTCRHPLSGSDFADDLLPAGLQDPRFIRGGRGQGMGGNLMGPNHPMFSGGGFGGLDSPPMGGPGSMQPRFDPVHPPGIDDGLSSGRGRHQKPSRTGEPNPDHLPPPNSLGGGSNMFL